MARDTLKRVEYDLGLQAVRSGWDGISFWVHARAGIVPGAGHDGAPAVVMTANMWLTVGSDVFYDLIEIRTDDFGHTWSVPLKHSTLGRRREPEDVEVAVSDYQPMWHAASGVLHCLHLWGALSAATLPSRLRRSTSRKASENRDPAAISCCRAADLDSVLPSPQQ